MRAGRERERERGRERIAQQIDPTAKADGLGLAWFLFSQFNLNELPFACESNSLASRTGHKEK